MKNKDVNYFKLQAKNLYRDYQTKQPYIDDVDGQTYYQYSPKYFDIDQLFVDYDWDEENFSLMKAQHLIANMVGFNKWADLLKAQPEELELAHLLLDNQEKIHLEDWNMYMARIEYDNQVVLDPASKLEIFKKVFLEEDGHHSPFPPYKLSQK